MRVSYRPATDSYRSIFSEIRQARSDRCVSFDSTGFSDGALPCFAYTTLDRIRLLRRGSIGAGARPPRQLRRIARSRLASVVVGQRVMVNLVDMLR
jgi:hypothetical protein